MEFLKKHIRTILFALAFIFMVLLLGLGLLVHRGQQTLRWGVAECLIWQTAGLKDRFIIDQSLNDVITRQIKGFASSVKEGQAGLEHGGKVVRAFYRGRFMLALMSESLKHLIDDRSAELNDSGSSRLIVGRFFSLVATQKIPAEKFAEIRRELMEEKTINTSTSTGLVLPEKIEVFKRSMDISQLRGCIEKMADLNMAADQSSNDADLLVATELELILSQDFAAQKKLQ
ncbi:MAG: hypothetical protein ACOYXC_04145 [Candidatus Rifleibacteriota bacterium]